MFSLGFTIFLVACEEPDSYTTVEAPVEIRKKAYALAEFYIGMEYDWGGQTHWSEKGVDCSGLVVNCYEEAVAGTPYVLPYSDAAVVNFPESYTVSVDTPERGDLVFMGKDSITHIAIVDKIEGGQLYFIDAYDGNTSSFENGEVTYRSYDIGNDKIKSFGRHTLYR